NQFVIINGDLILTRRGSLYSRVAAVFSFFCWRVYRW
ncbi:glutaredoxin, partial [Escherichia coli]|nr:glutaredoxin [Escherichia coli]